MRITFAAGSAAIALAIALNLFGGHLGTPIHTPAGDIPIGAIFFLMVGEAMVFTFAALASLQMNGRPRWMAVAVMLIALVMVMAVNGVLVSLGLIVPVALLITLMVLSHRHRWASGLNLRAALATAAAI